MEPASGSSNEAPRSARKGWCQLIKDAGEYKIGAAAVERHKDIHALYRIDPCPAETMGTHLYPVNAGLYKKLYRDGSTASGGHNG